MYSKEEERVEMEMIQDVDDDALHAELIHMVMCGDDDDNGVQNPSTDFDAKGTTTITKGEIWQLDENEDQGNFLDVNESSSNMFYDDQFPVLPDFSYMSSSSSTSSTPASTNPVPAPSASSASTSSSAASWVTLKSDSEEDMENKDKGAPAGASATLSSTLSMDGMTPSDGGGINDCMDMMEDFGYLDILDSNETWDSSSILDQSPQEWLQLDDQSKQHHDEQEPLNYFIHQEGRNGNSNNDVVQDHEEKPLDDMGLMFFEWLKSNKDSISAEDMRKIKLRTSTIECATKRLGSSKEGQKKLVKLILDWVAKCQLRKKREEAAAAAAAANQYLYPCQEPPPPPPQIFPNPNPNYNFGPPADPNSCFPPSPWIPPAPAIQPYVTAPLAAPPPPMTFMGGADHPYNNNNPALSCANPYNNCEYQMLDSSQPWNQSHISHFTNPYPDHMGNSLMDPGYVTEQYPYPPQMYNGTNSGDQIQMRAGASATKEARKKRMARQRRFSWTHHHPRHHHHHHQQSHQNQANFDNCSNKNVGNWGHWAPPVVAPGATPMQMIAVPPPLPPQPVDAQPPPPPRDQQVDGLVMQGQNGPKQTPPAEKKQGWKSEKNLKFLLQKVLKQSDVGNLGRIVLPKKEAETHLPELESRDGISISMEDIGTSKVWNMRYRFWPNNKSRMYLLENTGDFVKANELQEGDFIVLYSDIKCGKYLIRGVKVREPETKPEPVKKGGKRNQRTGTLTSPSKKHQKAEKAQENEKEKEKGGGAMCK